MAITWGTQNGWRWCNKCQGSGAGHLGVAGEAVLAALLDDDNPAVRKTALNAVPADPGEELLAKLIILRDVEPEPMVQALAARIVDNGPGGTRSG